MLARQLHHHPAWTPADLAADLAAARDRLASEEPLAGVIERTLPSAS